MKESSVDMLGRGGLLRLDEALARIFENLPPAALEEEEVSLEASLGRVLAADLVSPEDLPPFPRSTMDGFAVRAAETFGATESLPAYLEVRGEVFMGEVPDGEPETGACFRIPTGGILPEGTDAVVMLEHTVSVDDRMIEVLRPVAPGTNMITRGEDVAAGQTALRAGQLLRAQDLGLLAGLGIDRVPVRRPVRAGIISTGDEIVPWAGIPPHGKIRDVNSLLLAGLVRGAGGLPRFFGIVPDEEDALRASVRGAMGESDVVMLSGSSSVGTRDMGERVLNSLGHPGVILHGIAVKPGKPVIAAVAGGKLLFGLPGHPVSAAVAFDLLVRPALRRIAGIEDGRGLPTRRRVVATLGRNLNSAAGRLDYVRVRLEPAPEGTGFRAEPALGKSGALSTMVDADGFILIDEAVQGLREGEAVEVFLFD